MKYILEHLIMYNHIKEKVNNYTPSEHIYKSFNKVTVKRNNYSNVNQNVVNKQKKS